MHGQLQSNLHIHEAGLCGTAPLPSSLCSPEALCCLGRDGLMDTTATTFESGVVVFQFPISIFGM